MAQAAPNGPNSEVISLDCSQLGSVDVVVTNTSEHANENAPAWGVGHVVGSNMVGIPFSLHIEGTFTPTEGPPESFSFDQAKGQAAPLGGQFDTCTFTISETNDFGTFEGTGTVLVFVPPGLQPGP